MEFILNNETIETTLPPGMVLADFIRYQQALTGTKLGCREGDCGACTVLVGQLENQSVRYESMTSCLLPLANVAGKHVVTVEGLNLKQLNVVQQAITDEGGTQCGFCTPGFVVSLCGYALSNNNSYEAGVLAVAGNICRCTGYKSIERAIQRLADNLTLLESDKRLDWLIEQQYIPAYFKQIQARLEAYQPPSESHKNDDEHTVYIGGGTDLYVQRPSAMYQSSLEATLDRSDLSGIWQRGQCLHIGASTTTEALQNYPAFKALDADMAQHFKLISSLQIRNMATVAGNLVNASPIGDLSILFLALNAQIVLNEGGALRTIPLHRFFKSYKNIDKSATEFVQEINVEFQQGHFLFNFEKVCKRTYLDIASVNTAASMTLDTAGQIQKAFISAGGLAPVPKFLIQTSEFLSDKIPSLSLLDEAIEIAQSEVAPIADVRGSIAYKRLLLKQLMKAHFIKFFPNLFAQQSL